MPDRDPEKTPPHLHKDEQLLQPKDYYVTLCLQLTCSKEDFALLQADKNATLAIQEYRCQRSVG